MLDALPRTKLHEWTQMCEKRAHRAIEDRNPNPNLLLRIFAVQIEGSMSDRTIFLSRNCFLKRHHSMAWKEATRRRAKQFLLIVPTSFSLSLRLSLTLAVWLRANQLLLAH